MNIEQLKEEVRIEDVLVHYGWEGTDWRGSHGWGNWVSCRCPFHLDKYPSASVNTDKGRFHCFVCDTSGDIIDIVQKMEHLRTVSEAKAWIAATFLR